MSKGKTSITRRDLLMNSLSAAGALGMRSFLLGLPPSFLAHRAMAATQRKFLVYICSQAGEPVNGNCPGSYLANTLHPSAFRNPVAMSLGGYNTQAAAPWANLPQDLLNQMNFIHHDTKTNSHSENENVLRLQGALKSASNNGSEMLPSTIAQFNAPHLGTMSEKPILVGDVGSNVTYNSVPLPIVAPKSIQSLFTGSISSTTTKLRNFRDQAVDELYSDLKANGTSAQRKYLDDHVNSSRQSRELSSQFLNSLSGLGASRQDDQMIAAAALIAANAAPVIVARLNFGGDNHSDNGADAAETTAHNEAIAAINTLFQNLKSLGKADETIFCLQGGVFGRSVNMPRSGRWRGHNGAHTVACLFGPGIKAGVTGGLDPNTLNSGGACTGINSVNGTSNNPDVARNQTLSSMGKTLMKACGVTVNEIDSRVTEGKILNSVLA